jgi:thymidylate kinase
MMPSSETAFVAALFSALNGKYDYAVLRNFEQLPNSIGGRDIDILLEPTQLRRFQQECAFLAERHAYKLVYATWDTQMWTIAFGRVGAPSPSLVQLDILVNLNVLGVIFLDEREVLAKRIFNGNVYHLPPLWSFLAKFIYSSALGAAYPEKYLKILNEIRDTQGAPLDAELKRLLNNDRATFQYWEANKGWRVLLQGLGASLRRAPRLQLATSARFVGRYLINLVAQRGLFITFTGPDGSGKTTVIEGVVDAFAKVNPPKRFHFRPHLLPNIGEAAVKLGVREDVDRRYHMPHRGTNKGSAQSFIRLTYYLIDYVVGYYVRIMPLRWRKHIVVMDRYFPDVVADRERSSIFLDQRLVQALRRVVPPADFSFFVRVDGQRILERKRELSAEAIDRIYRRLDNLVTEDPNHIWVDNNGPSEDAVNFVLGTIFESQHRRLWPSLGGDALEAPAETSAGAVH